MSSESPSSPRLLVSVRSVEEARAALAGGCDIVDIKEPKRGSLGMSDPLTISAVVAAADPGTAELSAALGEAADWLDASEVPPLPGTLRYLKMGFASLAGRRWQDHWRHLRERFERASGTNFGWVAVAYADWERARAPEPAAVIAAAAAMGAKVVLFDTHVKDGRSLIDWISIEELRPLQDEVHAEGMHLVLAGSLRASHLTQLSALQPYAIAVRTAGCRNGQRTGQISSSAVRDFKTRMQKAFASD